MTTPTQPLPIQLSTWKRFRSRLEALGVHILAGIVPVLPRGLVLRIGKAVGWLAYFALPEARKLAHANLDMVYSDTLPAREKSRIARVSCQNFATTLLAFFWSPRLNQQSIKDIIEVDEIGLQLVRNLQAQGRPIILITLHYGDWELLGLVTGFLGIQMTIPTRTMRNTAVEKVFARLRALTGHRIVPRRHAVGKLLKALQHRECIALLIDQHVPVALGGIWCKFFGVPALTTPATAQLALHSGAAIIGSVVLPLPDGRYSITYGPIIDTTQTGNKSADILAITQRCLDFCEGVIRARPEYWLWSYKRWKNRPHLELGAFPFYSSYLPPSHNQPPSM